jgi:hypothetical protein
VAGVSLIADEPAVAAAETSQGVTAGIVAVIEAAAAQFVGKPVRILSIRVIDEPDGDSNLWGSQGRDIIQTSHNLVQRGH